MSFTTAASTNTASASNGTYTYDNESETGRPPSELDFKQHEAYSKCFKSVLTKPFPGDGRLYCNRTFDGWGCWDDTPAGTYAHIPCPADVMDDFDPRLYASKYCTENATWWRHPVSQQPWANYTSCINRTDLESGTRALYVYIVGYSISIATLMISLFIFYYFRQLQCERITLHRNLFLSYTLCALTWILYYTVVSMNVRVLQENSVWCRGLNLATQYFTASNFFWMFCEGFYLHTKLVFAFVSGHKLLVICRLIGWVSPVSFVIIYGALRATSDIPENTDSCWTSKSSYQWIVFVPIVVTLLLNAVFLCNIVRLLVTKLRALNSSDAKQTRQATRATLILIPLLGIQFILFPIHPEEGTRGRNVYKIASALMISLQGFFVSVIYCFFNGEVLCVLRRKWHQHQLMKGRRDTGTMWTISYSLADDKQTTTTDMTRSTSSTDKRLSSSYKLNGVGDDAELKHMLSDGD